MHPQPRSRPRKVRDLLALADQCVKCGLCLPQCPTYRLTRHEADSPRGRIALIQGWARGHLALTPVLERHLDGCLACRACESACPSLVAYGRLAEVTRARRIAARPAARRLAAHVGLALLSHAPAMQHLAGLARVYRSSGLATLLERLGVPRLSWLHPWHRLAVELAGTARRLPSRRPPDADLELFAGCMGASAQGAALEAALAVCDALGLRARLAPDSACCGTLLRHGGFPEAADRRLARAGRVDASVAGRPLVGLASACVAALRESPAAAREVLELCDYLDRLTWPSALSPRPLSLHVLVHEPCTHRRLPGGNAAVHRLLARIPELRIAPLADPAGCCGGAGTYPLREPAAARRLLETTLAALPATPPDVIVTTSPGCALHLAAGLRASGLNIRVCHPVELLAAQLDSRVRS